MAGNYGAGAGSIERHASASGRNRQKKQVHSLFSRGVMDLTFFLIVMTLLVIGIIMMFSASYAKALNESGGTNGTSYATKQITMAAIGIFCMFFFSFFCYRLCQSENCYNKLCRLRHTFDCSIGKRSYRRRRNQMDCYRTDKFSAVGTYEIFNYNSVFVSYCEEL